MAVVATELGKSSRRAASRSAPARITTRTRHAAQPRRRPAATPPGAKTVTIIDGSSGKAGKSLCPRATARRSPQPRRRWRAPPATRSCSRTAAPRRDPEDRPRTATRPPTPMRGRSTLPPGKADAPRIAIIVGGLGISASATAEALAKLPRPVTLAFAPYGADRRAARNARARRGHEVLLQVPMEPFDYPDNDPGPQTLLTSLAAGAEYRPPALADEPLPGLCRHRQLHGRALHRVRAALGPCCAKPASAG